MSKVAITVYTVALAGALVAGLGLSPCFAADQASHLGGSVETLPASLDALFPPTAQGPVFLFKMHAMEPKVDSPEIKKPLICQAGSAEAFVGSSATGREQLYYWQEPGKSQALS